MAEHVRPSGEPALIVGSKIYADKPDRRKAYGNAIGMDMQYGKGVDYLVDLELDLPEDIAAMRFNHVECMSVLEHSRRPWLMAKNIESMMEDGASIFIAVPFSWRVHGYPDDYWRMTISGVKSLFKKIEWSACKYATSGGLHEKKIPELSYSEGLERKYYARTETCCFGVKRT